MSNLTSNDIKAATIFAKASIDSCGEFNEVENMSYYNAKDLADEIGLSLNAVGGVLNTMTFLPSLMYILSLQSLSI